MAKSRQTNPNSDTGVPCGRFPEIPLHTALRALAITHGGTYEDGELKMQRQARGRSVASSDLGAKVDVQVGETLFSQKLTAQSHFFLLVMALANGNSLHRKLLIILINPPHLLVSPSVLHDPAKGHGGCG